MAGVEPSTGAVRMLVGGPGFDRYQFDLATQGSRQPGSSFKTFVLTEAMEQGYSPNDLIDGHGPCDDIPGYPVDDPPENFGGSRGGTSTLTSQTLRSSNCAFLRLGQVVGMDKVVDLAHRMGMTTAARRRARRGHRHRGGAPARHGRGLLGAGQRRPPQPGLLHRPGRPT